MKLLQQQQKQEQQHEILNPTSTPMVPTTTTASPISSIVIIAYQTKEITIATVQSIIYIILIGTMLYTMWNSYVMIIHDFSILNNKQQQKTWSIIAKCANDYRDNQCNSVSQIQKHPALREICENLETCIIQNTEQSSLRIMAELVADILNGFFMNVQSQTIIYLGFICVLYSMISPR